MCEDYPCCGHEPGCCPSYDDNGNQLDMKCTCGASVPLSSSSSLCSGCLGDDEDLEREYALDHGDEDSDVQAMKDWCVEHYDQGADIMVECWEKSDYEEVLNEEGSLAKAIEHLASIASVYTEREADAAYYRDEASGG